MHVQGNADGCVRRNASQASKQLTFTIRVAFSHHGAMQIEKDGVTALGNSIANSAAHVLVCLIFDWAAWPSMARNRHCDGGTGLLRKFDECTYGRTRTSIGADGSFSLQR